VSNSTVMQSAVVQWGGVATVKDRVNAIARIVYAAMGYTLPEGYDFESATHPAEVASWVAACQIWQEFTGDSPDLDAEID
jgi:hypothetical protein